MSRIIVGVGLCAGLALTAGALPASADPGTGDGTTTNLLYSVNGGAWTDSPVAQRGDTVTARLFYDTTREDTLSGVSLTSQIPEGFSYVAGSTRNVLAPGTNVLTGAVSGETKESPVADSVWSGDTITVSPSAGFNGESNASQQGVLRNGVKRYVNLHECVYYSSPTNLDGTDRTYYDTRTVGIPGRPSGTNVSNSADAGPECGSGSAYYADGVQGRVAALDLLGNRYLNLHECSYVSNATTGDGHPGRSYWDNRVLGSGDRSAGTNMSNTADAAADCGPGSVYYVDAVQAEVAALDLVGSRYLNLHECSYVSNATAADGHPRSYWDNRVVGISGRPAGTNVSNTADAAAVCGPGSAYYVDDVQGNVAALDLLDTARGQGFIEFEMTSEVPEAPACGETVTEPEVVSDREGVMTGAGTGTPTSTATVTLAEYTATGEECAEVVLVDDSESTAVDTPVDVDVQANDTIPEGSTGWEVDTTSTEGGTVVDNGDGTVTYTPPAGFVGTDTFTYRVTGPDGVEYEATVTVTVTEDEEPPVPMVAPGMAAVTLLGAGLLTAIRRRKA